MNAICEIIKPGLNTTIQDDGRYGMQKFGIIAAGAMDQFSFQIGNLLVGNKSNAAAIEVAMFGPKIRFLQGAVIAITGADLSAKVSGKTIPLFKSIQVERGDLLEFGQPKIGSYAYIAFHGGIDVPLKLGSRSTDVKSKLGGYEGRPLKKGDRLQLGPVRGVLHRFSGRGLRNAYIPDYQTKKKIRVILGPDQHLFPNESIETFLSGKYIVGRQANRMGYRLTGPKLTHINTADILSDAILPGTIQVPANGEPIILLADRQTTGGYARIATVISTDIRHVAQKKPGDEIGFEPVSLAEARAAYLQEENFLKKIVI